MKRTFVAIPGRGIFAATYSRKPAGTKEFYQHRNNPNDYICVRHNHGSRSPDYGHFTMTEATRYSDINPVFISISVDDLNAKLLHYESWPGKPVYVDSRYCLKCGRRLDESSSCPWCDQGEER